jgi:hypothetical protein
MIMAPPTPVAELWSMVMKDNSAVDDETYIVPPLELELLSKVVSDTIRKELNPTDNAPPWNESQDCERVEEGRCVLVSKSESESGGR